MADAIFNFIALLGWNPGGEQEKFSPEELVKLFDEKRLSKSPAAFDQKKLEWMDNEYIKHAEFEPVFELTKPFLEEAGRFDARAEELVKLYKPQMKYAEEILELTDLFFGEFPELTDEARQMMDLETSPVAVGAFRAKLENLEDFTAENIFPLFKETQKETGVKGKNLWMPIRIAASGSMHGPELPETIALLGKEKVLEHMAQFL